MKNGPKIVCVFCLISALLTVSAFSKNLESKLSDDVKICIDELYSKYLRHCLEAIYVKCTSKHRDIECNYNIALMSYEYYLEKKYLDVKSMKFMRLINNLINARCSEIADSETNRAARNWSHSRCIFEGRILSIMADNPLAKRG